ncbi:uncharacterized protein LOC126657306 [Mercurialis annua]|uniref:uncharacterized protein LOC126657306 n=1 Tax=Mercurialis annua TaxID=3986 RepID=UPI00215E0784|nr:uncharacterized protein LOC126657306 [Mercurialis annua]
MASSSNSGSLSEMYSRITLAEEEDGGLEILEEEEGMVDKSFDWCLVGRVLTDTYINFSVFKQIMAGIWKPVHKVCIEMVAEHLFVFKFFHELDMRRVIEDGPWTFEKNLIITKRLSIGEIPGEIVLWFADFLVHVLDVLAGYATEKVGENVGNYLGKFVKCDLTPIRGSGMNSFRIRVSLDVRRPLQRRMKLRRGGGKWSWLNFQYERLPMFCFCCGIIGHWEKFCAKYFENPIPKEFLPYDSCLRVNLKKMVNTGDRWLQPSSQARVSSDEEGDEVEALNGKISENLKISYHNRNLNLNMEDTRKVGGEGKSNPLNNGDLNYSGYGKDKGESKSSEEAELTLDSKRKRLELGFSEDREANGSDFQHDLMIIDPYNNSPVGPGIQAR